jgi:hypothetical protein
MWAKVRTTGGLAKTNYKTVSRDWQRQTPSTRSLVLKIKERFGVPVFSGEDFQCRMYISEIQTLHLRHQNLLSHQTLYVDNREFDYGTELLKKMNQIQR